MILYSDDELGQQHPIGNTGGYIDPYFAPFYQNLSPFWAHQASMVLGSVYNFFFVVVMNFVLLAIISGYIIDTFGSMRDANEAIEQDKRNRCFVCSLKREEFERNGISFTKVIRIVIIYSRSPNSCLLLAACEGRAQCLEILVVPTSLGGGRPQDADWPRVSFAATLC